MPKNQISQLNELKSLFEDLERFVKAELSIGHTTVLKELENFFCGFLNLVYGWNLVDANKKSKNAAAIDLIDVDKRISVQVTVTTGAGKIHKTLQAFSKANLILDYDRVVMGYPFFGVSTSTADFSQDCPNLNFDAERDCLDLGKILRYLQAESNRDKNVKITEFLEKELRECDRSSTLPVDANVSFMIDLINHITDDTSIPISPQQTTVDQDKKFARFVEHATWLKRQYTNNLTSYISIEAAESAIGMDHIHGQRIAGWLRYKSDEQLEDNGNNPRKAFNALVKDLFHSVGRPLAEVDEMAVRYFLATHLSRCNVFPNPESSAS